ncbi:uncharacterized protein LOC119390127 [Rhipicephalus sanguineus]|uniref:uncharacterized protein LOC119390127 n=1 Tax=Rhipicephalus sanguineus TaxID=34632 RepID=UPI00189607C4|nr:uncharacterized protein LOC119390127 [Rhipicephalus sanguineus]
MQRKERSFQECLEFLMPVYLLPFIFGDKEGTSIYCILLTVLGLMGRLLPPAVAAMLPIVILPLGDIKSAEWLAPEYMGPRVLTASLLFTIAFLCDETTVFFRLSLHALRRYALRMQPLFLYTHLPVFALSLLLPSNLIVVFSTVFIDRFVTTVHNEIVGTAEQRGSVVRILSGSTSLNYFEDGRRPRWGRISGAMSRKARSVSMVSEMTGPSEVSGSSSLVKQYRMHPPVPLPIQATLAAPRPEARQKHQIVPHRNPRRPEHGSRKPSVAKNDARPSAPQTAKSKVKTLPESKVQPESEPVAPPKSAAVKLDPKPETKTEARTDQEPEPKTVEVRGVLKKRYLSLQPSIPSIPSRSGSVPCGRLLSPSDNDQLYPMLQCPLPTTDLTGQEQQTSSLRVRALILTARPAFIAGAAYAAIFGNIASFSTLPARGTVLFALGCRDDECPVNWWRWFAVSLPVAMICCLLSWTFIYCANLVSCDDEIDEQTHEDMSRCARARQQNMKKHTMREALLFYWLVGIPVVSSAYATRHPDGYVEGPFLGLTLLVLSTAPESTWRRCWSFRLLCWRRLCSRIPWNIILMLGSITALTKTVEEYRLVELCLSKLDDQFWTQRSTKSSQFILVSLAAVLSELVVGDSLARSMAATVVRVAVVTETPVSFYVIPVSLAASINVMLPVSLPLLIMREYQQTKSSHMVACGVFLKCAAVIVIFISMNTIGLILFQEEPPAREHAIFALHNATDVVKASTL